MPEVEPRFALYKDANRLLTLWQPSDRVTQLTRDGLVTMMTSLGYACFEAATLPGHVTVSMAVWDWELRRTLLVNHRVAGWLQPGGHVQPDDRTLQKAAVLKVERETGVRLGYVSRWPIGVDVHPILCAGEWALHWDVRFAGKATREARPELAVRSTLLDLRWFEADRLHRHGAASREPLVRTAQRRLRHDEGHQITAHVAKNRDIEAGQ